MDKHAIDSWDLEVFSKTGECVFLLRPSAFHGLECLGANIYFPVKLPTRNDLEVFKNSDLYYSFGLSDQSLRMGTIYANIDGLVLSPGWLRGENIRIWYPDYNFRKYFYLWDWDVRSTTRRVLR